MLDWRQLARLRRSVSERPCLSLYVAGADTDPASQGAWSRRLHNVVREERKRVEGERADELTAFDRAWGHLNKRLPDGAGALGFPGWAGFSDSERVLHDAPLRSDVGTTAAWGPGVRLTPYARALGREQTVVLVLVDGRHARGFRHVGGRLTELEDLTTEHEPAEADGPGMMKAASTTGGVRGETRHDAAQRALRVATERLVRGVAKSIEGAASDASAVVLGGIDRVALAVNEALPESVQAIVHRRPDLHLAMSEAELDGALRGVLGEVVRRREQDLLRFWSEEGRSRGLALSGWNSTMRALDEGAVETLLLSTRLIEEQPDDAEVLVSRVVEGGGEVVEFSEEAGQILDREGGGIGVCLRFAPSMESV